ncbi:helix-turn-helix domain-containing protein [Staphylococcus capitis]|uniref:winged helix-turn-helix transcriptional regulator n=1 Tax=Staphylococcus TaxID=1279 RepID=UPI00064A198F|nr:winged helix-turn-helix transcriptional regulator [Staphylococcus capitis]DAI86059.1 MAG TPA: helix-turn-helix domain protein [Caudoviricetes sp.]AKL91458.1 putative transcriptional regulator [Staphylococcus capitis subsp. capitis]MCC0829281.1 helix-turn-helix domain-containing protein [Staphylococcus capitis]MCC3744448.1 helix-turn-helix domain-containing protein [Staphylococcus capitis]MCC9116547.1 helix-turn-helix domain-containing protein [Staphylococcus capitis]
MTIIRSAAGLGVLTKEVRIRKDLTFFEKILICELDSLTNNIESSTDISNEELSELYGVSESTVKRAIKKLEKIGFIEREVENVNYINRRKITVKR